jgi:hypothetical protein
MKFILEAFANRVADEIKPSDIDSWISAHDWSPATKNRYKNMLGKTFKIALTDGKVTSNHTVHPWGGLDRCHGGRVSPPQASEDDPHSGS